MLSLTRPIEEKENDPVYLRYHQTQRNSLRSRLRSRLPADLDAAKEQLRQLSPTEALVLLHEILERQRFYTLLRWAGTIMAYPGFHISYFGELIRHFPVSLATFTSLSGIAFLITAGLFLRQSGKHEVRRTRQILQNYLSFPVPTTSLLPLLRLTCLIGKSKQMRPLYPQALDCLTEILTKADITPFPYPEQQEIFAALRHPLQKVLQNPESLPRQTVEQFLTAAIVTLEPDSKSIPLISDIACGHPSPRVQSAAELVAQQQSLQTLLRREQQA